MAWGVQDRKVAVRRREMPCGYLNGNSSLLLLLRVVHDVSVLKSCLVVDVGLALVCSQLLVSDDTVLMEDFAGKRAFPTVNVADDNQV